MCWGRCERVALFVNAYEFMAWVLGGSTWTNEQEGRIGQWQKTCSSPIRALRFHSLVCSKNSLLIVGIRPILNKELELIFRSDRSDRTCVYS